MNNALHTAPVMNSFKLLWQWSMAKPGQAWQPTPVARPMRVGVPALGTAPPQRKPGASSTAAPSGPVLRVLQVMEAGQNAAQSGRWRLSGRMADVCAELDRLAAREAMQH